eukprot:5349672-Amphidinium_carterae.1
MLFTAVSGTQSLQLEADESYFALHMGEESCGARSWRGDGVCGLQCRPYIDSEHCKAIRAANRRALPPPLNRKEWLQVARQHVLDEKWIVLHAHGVSETQTMSFI